MKNIEEGILAKYCENTLSHEEEAGLRAWLESDNAHQKELEQYQKLWMHAAKVPEVNTHKAWKKVAKRTVEKNAKRLPVVRYAASLLIIGAIGALIWLWTMPKPEKMLTVQTGKKSKTVLLADGSKVNLNSYSVLAYPEEFDEDSRQVKIIGEAFFDIAKNPDKPFVIAANGTEIRVLGTSFLVSARSVNVKVSVRTGRVEFKGPHEQKVVLGINETAEYKANEDSVLQEKVLDSNIFALQTKNFRFENSAIQKVVADLNYAYQADIKLDVGNWEGYKLTVQFENESLDKILEIMVETLKLKLTKNGETILISKIN